MSVRCIASFLLLIAGTHPGMGQPPTAPDASTVANPAPATVTGTYNVGPVGNPTTQLQAVVYRPAVLPAAAPVVIILHGNHGTCGRPYNPAAAATPPQATLTIRVAATGMVAAVFPIDMIDTPGLATGQPVVFEGLPPAFTQTYSVIAANTLDPPGLPCTRPVPGGACMEGNRIDNWAYVPGGAPRTCTAGLTEVTSHTGYEYLGLRLAAQGYVVVSIDADPVNNAGSAAGDLGLIQARGTLVINHLRQLSTWSTAGGAPASAMIPMGGLDMGHVALVGHSRGGEGVRAAYNMAAGAGIAGLNIDAVYEIAPTDFQGQNAAGTPWNVLLPMCDADVTNLAGVRPFDRMMRTFTETPTRQKSDYNVWGANHNFFNTQWMVSDTFRSQPVAALPDLPTVAQAMAARFQFGQPFPCTGGAGNMPLFTTGGPGSPAQRLTALSSIPALVRGNVGNAAVPVNATFNQNFNTLFRLPTTVSNEAAPPAAVAYPPPPAMRVDRGYSPTANCSVIQVMEDFNQPSGTNTSGQLNTSAGITVVHLNGQAALESTPPRGINANCTAEGMPFACCTGFAAGTCAPPPGAPAAPPAACQFGTAPPATPAGSAPPIVPLATCLPGAPGGNPTCIPNHDESQRVGYIRWTAAGAGVFLQTNWTAPRTPGRNVSAFSTLEFRVSRNFDAANNAAANTNFSIQLVGANGVLTRARLLSDYTPVANDLRGPVGGGVLLDKNHPILQTYRIPLAHFGNIAAVSPQVSGVRFTFDQTARGAIFLANVRFANTLGAGVASYPALAAAVSPAGPLATPSPTTVVVHSCVVGPPQFVSSVPPLGGGPGWTIAVFSPTNFESRNALPVLTLTPAATGQAAQQFTASYAPGADTNGLVFALTDAQFASLPSNYTAQVQYGMEGASEIWRCASLVL